MKFSFHPENIKGLRNLKAPFSFCCCASWKFCPSYLPIRICSPN